MTITFILGTRPEVIKLATVIRQAIRQGDRVRLIHTGQHMELTEPLLRFFGLREMVHEFFNLQSMMEKSSLTGLSSRVLDRLESIPGIHDSDWIVVQGDTTSAFIGAYFGFCHRIPVAHVEAGLRTGDLSSPFPEEANRVLIARIADLHLAPTSQAMRQLLEEGVEAPKVFLTGNTSIDALLYTMGKIDEGYIDESDRLPDSIQRFISDSVPVLVTAHRRENHGEPLSRICKALRSICEANKRVRMVLPVHPNPAVRSQIQAELGTHPQILLCEPLNYVPFVDMMARAHLLITDSGGVQEEGPTLRKPIIVIRESTERPEGVEAGFASLAGTCPDKIFESAQAALRNGCTSTKDNPYGDGRASTRILTAMRMGLPEHASLSSVIAPERVAIDILTRGDGQEISERRLNTAQPS